nr:hypothetical protein GCM10020093_110930 [Planobispora longispora]
MAVTRELERARAELAEAAVLRERLRISRDLHDGLGSSLTTIALKGDLARRLVERDPVSAGHELADLVQVARDAAQDVRNVARGYRGCRWRRRCGAPWRCWRRRASAVRPTSPGWSWTGAPRRRWPGRCARGSRT